MGGLLFVGQLFHNRGPRASPAKRVAWGKEEQRNERAVPLAVRRGI